MTIYSYRKGSNQFQKTRHTSDLNAAIALILGVTVIGSMFAPRFVDKTTDFLKSIKFEVSAPLVVAAEVAVPGITEKPLTVDEMVNKYSDKYGTTRYQQNRFKALTHFLLLREQNYGGSTSCGDEGLACGPLQFHEATYIANRKDMVKKGLATEMGSRLDMENAIDTAIYMFSIGQENQWGPYLRGEIKL